MSLRGWSAQENRCPYTRPGFDISFAEAANAMVDIRADGKCGYFHCQDRRQVLFKIRVEFGDSL